MQLLLASAHPSSVADAAVGLSTADHVALSILGQRSTLRARLATGGERHGAARRIAGRRRPHPAGAEGAGQGIAGGRVRARCSTAARASTGWSSCQPTGSPATPARRSSSSPASRRAGTRSASAAWRPAPMAGCPTARVIEILNDDMPFLVDSVLGELQARGLAVRAAAAPDLQDRARQGRPPAGRSLGAGDENWSDGHQESYIAVHLKPLPEPAAARSRRRALGHPRRGARRGRRLEADAAAPARRRSRQLGAGAGQRAARPAAPKSIAFLRMARSRTTSPSSARASSSSPGDAEAGDLVAVEGSGLGVLRDAERAGAAPRHRAGRHDAGGAPLLLRARAAHHHQGQRGEPRAPARAHGLHRHQDLPRATAAPKGEIRLVGLFTSQAYVRPPQPDPVPAPQGRHGAGGLRLSARQP